MPTTGTWHSEWGTRWAWDAAAANAAIAVAAWHCDETGRRAGGLVGVTSPVQSQQAPGAGREPFPSVFDNVQVGMATSGLDGRLLQVNRAMSDLLGYDTEQLTARSWADITHPDDVAESARLLSDCVDGRVPGVNLDARFLHADGHVVTASLTMSLIRGDDGRPLHIATQMTDSSKKRALDDQLRGQRHQYTRLLDGLSALGEGVLVYDGGRIVYVNDALCGMTGYDHGQLMAMDAMKELVAAEEVEETRALAGGDDLRRGTLVLRRHDGGEVQAEFATVDITLDGHDGRLSVVRDLSERLRSSVELQAANQLRTDLLAMLSHDMAQPLTAIRGYLRVLADKWSEMTDETRVMLIGKARANAERLGEMVGQILAMGQVDGPTLTPKPERVPLAAAVDEALAHLADGVTGVRVTEVGADAVLADPGHLQQILMNLLSNAGKYGRPPYEVSARDVAGGQVELRVRDHGEGVPADFVPHLFERYTRAQTDEAPGTGLGLFIVRRLAEANGGTIFYEAGAGACLVLRLPAPD